jgi:hypothetical protein
MHVIGWRTTAEVSSASRSSGGVTIPLHTFDTQKEKTAMTTRIKGVRSDACFLVCISFVVCLLAGCDSVHEGNTERRTIPSVSVEKHTYAPGESIQVNFSNAPGNQYDWIAVYNDGVKPGSGIFTSLFLFTDGTNPGGTEGIIKGTLMFDSAADNPENTTVDWPLAEGEYDVYLFCCDDYGVLAGPAEFTIVSGGGD